MSFRVRQAQASDYEVFTQFWAELGFEGDCPSEDVWMFEIAPHSVFVPDSNGNYVAYARARAMPPVGRVEQLWVLPHVRDRGFGRQLLIEVGRRLREMGCKSLQIETEIRERVDVAGSLKAEDLRKLANTTVPELQRLLSSTVGIE
jgi:GNAT superfamily N-acetyltransferase